MTKDQDKIRVGSTPRLKYTLRDPRGNAVSVVDATSLEITFIPPSGGTASSGTPALFSGTTNEVHYQTSTSTFDIAGEWIVAVRASFGASRVYESTVDKIHVEASRY